ncbi:MAG: sigma-70 family RNA polymerase sigma factor [Gemmobacter sp.]|uniref:sigma-70 family RNA polymerase sigma factor n=1 Tax=Gemmobacter sp. TaxID=1898957 RepID=UPI001A591E3C|nr:sigma-70 family RNA polymerase sigma factor [Gemmobacter sp.]MBL8563966.1 sigma-70 family RNA polymerase sigma factor [Gemmobacter sp.]
MSVTEQTLAELLRAANAGDGQAYARFLLAVTPVLRTVVQGRGRVLDRAAQEDVVQDVLLAIHMKRHTWRADAPLKPWLYAVARYKVADAFRRLGVGRLHLPLEDFADALESAPAPEPLAARDADRLLGQLDPRSASIVRAAHLEGEETAAIGARLSMSEGAVRVALHRAMKRLAVLAGGKVS